MSYSHFYYNLWWFCEVSQCSFRRDWLQLKGAKWFASGYTVSHWSSLRMQFIVFTFLIYCLPVADSSKHSANLVWINTCVKIVLKIRLFTWMLGVSYSQGMQRSWTMNGLSYLEIKFWNEPRNINNGYLQFLNRQSYYFLTIIFFTVLSYVPSSGTNP